MLSRMPVAPSIASSSSGEAIASRAASAARLAEESCVIEIERCDEPIGKQDQYAAAFGGFNYIRFHADDRVEVTKVVCPGDVTAELQRRWWRWINRSPEHLALVRLGLEAATLDATVSALHGDVRAEQISFWREGIADGLIADGITPEDAEREASLVKATFTGLVLDLLATGQRTRLTAALECTLSRLDALTAR